VNVPDHRQRIEVVAGPFAGGLKLDDRFVVPSLRLIRPSEGDPGMYGGAKPSKFRCSTRSF
jgi:hypothetical protein